MHLGKAYWRSFFITIVVAVILGWQERDKAVCYLFLPYILESASQFPSKAAALIWIQTFFLLAGKHEKGRSAGWENSYLTCFMSEEQINSFQQHRKALENALKSSKFSFSVANGSFSEKYSLGAPVMWPLILNLNQYNQSTLQCFSWHYYEYSISNFQKLNILSSAPQATFTSEKLEMARNIMQDVVLIVNRSLLGSCLLVVL